MRETSEPERTRSLPNRHLDLRHEDFAVKAPVDFGRRGCLEEQCERLDEVGSRLFNGRPLTRDVKLRAQGYETVALTLYDRGYAVRWLHSPSLQQLPARSLSRLGSGVRAGGRTYCSRGCAGFKITNCDLKRHRLTGESACPSKIRNAEASSGIAVGDPPP